MAIEDAFCTALLYEYLSQFAVEVRATEAAAFVVRRGRPTGTYELDLAAHIRPDDSKPAVREAAREAFRDIVRRCVEEGKDGAIEVGSPDGGEPQFCLVRVIHAERVVRGVAAWIVRAADQAGARALLRRINHSKGE